MNEQNREENLKDRAQEIADFIHAVESVISTDLSYRRADLDGFIRAAWPCDGTPEDIAAQFVEQLAQ